VKKCPRCHSSMLLDYGDSREGWDRMWKCLGCGREILYDAHAQAEDDRLLHNIRSKELSTS